MQGPLSLAAATQTAAARAAIDDGREQRGGPTAYVGTEVEQVGCECAEDQHKNRQPQHEQQQQSMTIAKSDPFSPLTSALRSSRSFVSSSNMSPPLLSSSPT
jgi:hypothetical protein